MKDKQMTLNNLNKKLRSHQKLVEDYKNDIKTIEENSVEFYQKK